MTRLQYPIGRFAAPDPITAAHLASWIEAIARLPGKLKDLVLPLSAEQLLTSYRPGGWTVQQVVHHLADSHLNSFIRLKWTLTEVVP